MSNSINITKIPEIPKGYAQNSVSYVRHQIWSLIMFVARSGFHRVLARFYANRTMQHLADGSSQPTNFDEKENHLTLLALSPQMFRGDLTVLASVEGIRILKLPHTWLIRMLHQFYPENAVGIHCMDSSPGNRLRQCKRTYQNFLRRFLPYYFHHLGVDGIITHHVHAHPGVDWGVIGEELGVRYIVLHRECLMAEEMKKLVRQRLSRLEKFEGSHIIVHNEACRRVISDSKFATLDQVSSLGCIRMDDYLDQISRDANSKREKKEGKIVSYFPFDIGDELDERLNPFFEEFHTELAKFIINRPDVNFVIKSKPGRMFDLWWARAKGIFAAQGIDESGHKNLKFRDDIDAQDLILQSDVVVGLNSTTMVEAAIARKPVVIPYFGEIQNPDFDGRLRIRDSIHCLDIADTKEAVGPLIAARLDDPTIGDEVMKERISMFERHLSTVDGKATENYIKLIRRVIEQGDYSP